MSLDCVCVCVLVKGLFESVPPGLNKLINVINPGFAGQSQTNCQENFFFCNTYILSAKLQGFYV